jgi:alpha-L-rhamnosidase
MDFPINFICATDEFCTFEKYVPAPYLRKSFEIKVNVTKADLIISGLGFYELYINGVDITKGHLAPYISAPDDIIYYDTYDITKHLKQGENVIGIILGNGMQNPFGGYVWDFDKARWRGAPKAALKVDIQYENSEILSIKSDESFKTSPSPIYFDDLRCGEYYDARNEQTGWSNAGFDDSKWTNTKKAPLPKGETVLCNAEPIVITQELKPVSITKQDDGYLFDFGVNCAGICRLTVNGKAGQEISLAHGEYLKDGILNFKNIQFLPDGYVQKDIYICKGDSEETYSPIFAYHGFQYVFVNGITEEQATEKLLTYLVMNSDLKERGNFECSDKTANTLQILTRRSTLANFYYFPTDCPHREKNGWTGDAALSAEHTLLNLSPEKSYKEWLRNIRKAQNEQGTLPGIVPTAGWGFAWGNGPAWDCVLTYLPYYTYIYRGDVDVLKDNATAMFRYLNYLSNSFNNEGLLTLGLGDWCIPNRGADQYKAPLEFTDTVMSMDICKKASYIFDVLNMDLQKSFADGLYNKLRTNVREKLIDFGTMTAAGNCQTSQAMAIFYDVFDNGEKQAAFEKLLKIIEQSNGHMDTGIIGARVIFHVLSAFNRSDLAFNMITRQDFPSYGNWVARGATSLWEDFQPQGGSVASLNHHFFGDISGWFIKWIAGINLNPYKNNVNEVNITPKFIASLDYAKGFHIAPTGEIKVEWKRESDYITLIVSVAENITGRIILENGLVFEDGLSVKKVASGTYKIINVK